MKSIEYKPTPDAKAIGRALIQSALQRRPILAVAATVVGSLLRKFRQQPRSQEQALPGASVRSKNRRKPRTGTRRTLLKSRATAASAVTNVSINTGGRRHG